MGFVKRFLKIIHEICEQRTPYCLTKKWTFSESPDIIITLELLSAALGSVFPDDVTASHSGLGESG